MSEIPFDDTPNPANFSGNENMREESSGDRRELNRLFGEIIKHLEIDEPTKRHERYDLLLDAINRVGVNGVAESARDSLQFVKEPYEPASESEVRSYLQWLRTNPPIKINDIGSVDNDLVRELRLTKDNYIEELRYLIEFLDASKHEISVLELPALLREMDDLELSALKKSLIQTILDEHGISFVYDMEDQKVWNRLRDLVEELARPHIRDYSYHLREKAVAGGGHTPIRDVYATINDRMAIIRNAFDIARDNVNAPVTERERMMETMPEHKRKRVQRFLDDLESLRDSANESNSEHQTE